MTIILNEHEWAAEMLERRVLGKKPFETLYRIARYYMDLGCNKRDTRKKLNEFLLRCDPCVSLPKWGDSIEFALTHAAKHPAVSIDSVSITDKELECIGSLSGKQIRRLAFTLLCLSKYFDMVNGKDSHWVNCKDSDIMRMANINTSIRRQSVMYHELYELGLVQFSKRVDNTNVRVCFPPGGNVVLEVSDFRNLGNQYLVYTGSTDYYKCKNCGIVIRKSTGSERTVGRPQIYCPQCSTNAQTRRPANTSVRPEMTLSRKVE